VRLPDTDADGAPAGVDCDDGDPAVRPGAGDVPGNGIDENCDGADERAAAPPPPPAVTVIALRDDDRDGASAAADCDDRDAAIRPGAPDRPGDRVDQDCSGADSRFPLIAPDPVVTGRWAAGRRTRVLALRVRRAPRGARVTVRCRGGGCPRRVGRVVATNGSATLTAHFKGRRLRPGAVVEVRVTAPGTVGRAVRWTVRRNKPPRGRRLCLPPGARAPGAC
jgi:hypothetical protein